MRELVKIHLEPDHISVWPRMADGLFSGDEPKPEDEEQLSPAVPLGDFAQDRQHERVGVSIAAENLTRTFHLAGGEIHALRDVSLEIPAGSMSVLKGPSGSGKTTLLHMIAGLDEPTSGAVRFGERLLAEMSDQEKVELCRQQIGFVFQTFGLLPFLSVEENVQVPLRLLRTPRDERQARVNQALDSVGLANRASHRTDELSGGEQQRVAIARALVKQPTLILADEPTGQLDSLTGASIIALLKGIATQAGVTVVVASHDPNVHEAADWLFELKDGWLVGTVD
jgi:putative ABC transport system ATP-binding protein